MIHGLARDSLVEETIPEQTGSKLDSQMESELRSKE